jgi:hypothetical protein
MRNDRLSIRYQIVPGSPPPSLSHFINEYPHTGEAQVKQKWMARLRTLTGGGLLRFYLYLISTVAVWFMRGRAGAHFGG